MLGNFVQSGIADTEICEVGEPLTQLLKCSTDGKSRKYSNHINSINNRNVSNLTVVTVSKFYKCSYIQM